PRSAFRMALALRLRGASVHRCRAVRRRGRRLGRGTTPGGQIPGVRPAWELASGVRGPTPGGVACACMFIGARPPLSPPDASLRARWADLRRAWPGISTRDAALALGASEAELLASACGDGVIRLAGAWGDLVVDLPALGPVVASTRNALAVHEKRGGYARIDYRGTTGTVLNDAIDVRLCFEHWRLGFAVNDGQRRTFEFFDAAGRTVHQQFLEPEGRGPVYDTLVARHASTDQSSGEWEPSAPDPTPPPGAPDPQEFRDRWVLLQGPEDADPLIASAGITRLAALRLIGPSWAYPVGRLSLQRLLAWVAADR